MLRLLELEAESNMHGVLVVVTGDITPALTQAFTRLGRRFKMVIVVSLPQHRYSARKNEAAERKAAETGGLLDRAGVKVLTLGSGDGLAASWSALWSPSSFAPGRVYREGGELWDRKPELA